VVPFRFSKRRNKEITTTLNRSPGYDGITVKLYRQFWESLKDLLQQNSKNCLHKQN
jgi:hypothetical protein